MTLLNYSIIGFLVVYIGTLLLFGEFLVKAKGIFAIIGVSFIALYFSYHINEGMGIWVAILLAVGLGLIMIDGNFVSDGTLALFGLVIMITAIAIPAPNFTYGFLVSSAALLGSASSVAFLKVFPPRNMWDKITLKDRLSTEAGYNSMNQSYVDLLGKQGKTKTPFRPTGTIELDGEYYSATTDNQWIAADVDIKVVAVDGTRILIKKYNPVEN
ncbi:MAG: nodulation protein NfeD [Bacillaceae bacterium]|nr:nodulation protein NfeD [Bacillaceae bacterium]